MNQEESKRDEIQEYEKINESKSNQVSVNETLGSFPTETNDYPKFLVALVVYRRHALAYK